MPSIKELAEFFSNTFLFKDISSFKLENILYTLNIEIKSYSKGEIICTFNENRYNLGFVFKGECEISRVINGCSLPINRLKKSGSFGIASIYSSEHKYPTQISAKKASTVIFIKRSDLDSILTDHPKLSINVIEFLADRVSFLNTKLSTFSMGDCIGKVASALIAEHESKNAEYLNFNCKSTAESLNIGRASLYRALHSLEDMDLILHENKKIYIKDPKGLKGISK